MYIVRATESNAKIVNLKKILHDSFFLNGVVCIVFSPY